MQDKPWFQHYADFTPNEIDFEEVSLPEMLRRSCRQSPDRVALHFLKTSLTFRELEGEIDRLAGGLVGLA